MADPLRFFPPPQGGLERHSAVEDFADLLPDLAPGIRLDALPFPGVVLVRCPTVAAQDGVRTVLGLSSGRLSEGVDQDGEWPTPGHVAAGDGCEVLCLSSDCSLVLLSGGQEDVLVRRLNQYFISNGSPVAAVVDLSDSYALFHLYGPKGQAVLAKGCDLDLNPLSLPAGRCQEVSVAGVSILLQTLHGDSRVGDVVYRLIVENSKANFFLRWLLLACDAY